MPVNMEEFVEQFDYNFSQFRDEYYELQPKEFPAYMREESSTRPFEKRSYIGALGLPIKNRDYQPLPISMPPKGFVSTFTPVQYRLGYIIDRQTIEDELWKLLADRPKSMVRGAVVIKDMVASDVLNNGLTSQPYNIDGQPLFSAAHPRENKSGVWSNLIDSEMPINVETVMEAVSNLLWLLTDSANMPIAYNGKINIYVPKINSVLVEQAYSVCNSGGLNPDTADRRPNAATGIFNLSCVPLRYLTNPNVWYVGWEPSSTGYGLTLIDRVAPEISPLQMFGDNNDVYFSRLRMRFTAGYETSRGIGAIGAA